jgi:hypothetical protein
MLKLANEIDKKLLELNLEFDYKKQQKKNLCSIFGFFSLITFLALFGAFIKKFYDVQLDSKLPLIHLFGFVCCTILLHHFLIGMIGIRMRLEKLNEVINHQPHLMDIRAIKKLTQLQFMNCKLIKK